MRKRAAVQNDWEYIFKQVALDQANPPSALESGRVSRMTGVDGRYRGALRVFPGFTDLNWGFSLADLRFFRGFEIQKGKDDGVLRGFVVLYDSGSSVFKLELKYYDGSWKTFTINSNFTGSQDDLDVATAGRFIYITGAREQTVEVERVKGSGLNDLTASGTYTGIPETVAYNVAIVNAAPSPDLFDVERLGDSILASEGMTGSAQVIGEGISITWGAIDGHTNGDEWLVKIQAGGASTLWWDNDSSDFLSEPMGSQFDDGDLFFKPKSEPFDLGRDVQLGFLSDAESTTTQNNPSSAGRLRLDPAFTTPDESFLSTTSVHGMAWRLRDTRRNVYSPLSMVVYGFPEGTGLAPFIADDEWAEKLIRGSTRWDRLEVFRTVANGVVLLREWEIDLDAFETGTPANSIRNAFAIRLAVGCTKDAGVTPFIEIATTYEGGATVDIGDFGETGEPTGFSDDQLAIQGLSYDFTLDSTVRVPSGIKRIGNAQGITVIQDINKSERLTDNSAIRTNTTLIYSPLQSFRPENFPQGNIIAIPQSDGQVQQFQAVGTVLWAGTPNSLWRIHPSGSRLAANRLEVGWGILNKGAMIEANNDLFVLTRRGLLLVQSGSGNPVEIGSVSRTVLDDWKDELAALPDSNPPDIQAAFDAALGAVFFLNTTQKECLIYWTATGQITFLEDVPWTLVTTLSDPTAGGSPRAWFAKSSDTNIYRADPERSETLGPTMLPHYTQVEGTADSGTSTTLVDATLSGVIDSTLVGHVIYVDVGGSGYQKATVTGASGTTITFSGGLSGSGTPLVGNRYILSPIRFNVVGWPMHGWEESDDFKRRRGESILAQPSVISGSLNAASRWIYEFYSQNNSTPAVTVEATWDNTADLPDDLPGYKAYSGSILRPGWLCVEPSIHYELLSGLVKGKLLGTTKVR